MSGTDQDSALSADYLRTVRDGHAATIATAPTSPQSSPSSDGMEDLCSDQRARAIAAGGRHSWGAQETQRSVFGIKTRLAYELMVQENQYVPQRYILGVSSTEQDGTRMSIYDRLSGHVAYLADGVGPTR